MLYITSSTGVFCYEPESNNISHVLTNRNRSGFFSKKSHGFFGICWDKKNRKIIAASREKLGTPNSGKPTTDAGLHYIDPLNNTFETIGYIKDVHDIHQIDISGDIVFLSDTGKNRIISYNITTKNIDCIINLGKIRDDINHINAITIQNDVMLVGLNNRGAKESEILHLPLSAIKNNTLIDDAFDLATKLQALPPYTNTHDIEPYNNSYLVCSSHDSIVFDSDSLRPVIKSENWVRGIANDGDYIWVAQSINAKRSKRHSKAIDGSILKVNSKKMEIIDTISIKGTGQINDLIYIAE